MSTSSEDAEVDSSPRSILGGNSDTDQSLRASPIKDCIPEWKVENEVKHYFRSNTIYKNIYDLARTLVISIFRSKKKLQCHHNS